MNGNDECVHEYDRTHLEHHYLSRKKAAHGLSCYKKCNESHDAETRNEQVKSMEQLTSLRGYLSCLRPCIETLIQYTDSETKIIDKAIANANKHLTKQQ